LQTIHDFFPEENATGVAFKNKSRKMAIINHLDLNGETTVADLAQALNLSVPKATSLIGELIKSGLIKDYGKVESTGGRPASMFGLVADSCFFIGVDVKEYFVNIGLLDFKKNLVAVDMQVPFDLANTKESLDSLIQIIRDFIRKAPVKPESILSLCINLGGRINTRSGYSYSFFHFAEEPLTSFAERALEIRTYLENDSRAMSYGEFVKGIGKNEKNVLFINIDYGIGLGILIDGKVYYGKSGFSGEFGHIPIFDNEILCHCGKKGCFETEASGRALIRLFKEKVEKGTTSSVLESPEKITDLRLTDIIEGAKNEDMLCIELLAEIGAKIGKGVAWLINIFNPEMVILGGTLIQTGDYIFLPIRSAINKYSLNLVNNDTKLCLSQLGEKAGVIGGCLISRDYFLSGM
jgi:predicted NBD/HSP70 family sugar kinase